MAEILLSPLLDRVIGSLVSLLAEEISLVRGVEDELRGLSSTLSAIRSLIADAEEKQLHSKSITDWLGKLKDVAYDAEDVVDDFNLEALQAKQAGDVVDSKKRKKGIGGLGKTTLARFVYDNEEVKKYFEVRGWVCASDSFEIMRVTKGIVDSITNEPREVTHPEVRLKDLIDGKRFLIVIDDVWEDALKYWDDFRIPFIHGNQGSKLIVTTRSKRVSSVMGTSVPFHLGGLLEEDCFKLFLKKVFVNDDTERYLNLVDIGKRIVKKCGGVPLAINTLGGLLTSTRNESEWNGVFESSFWKLPQDENSILPALRLSYHHLPQKVKSCFAFCSLFPKDWSFVKGSLIRMWMALGYIQLDGQREEEVIGDEYFNDLLMVSFFTRVNDYEYTMHDLVHDLAESLAKEECIRLHNKRELIIEKSNVPQRVRHASLILNVLKISCDDIKILRRLRTLVCPFINYVGRDVIESFVNTIELHFLHILSLSGSTIHRLPNDLGCFPLLRHLDLSQSEIEELPDSIYVLSNLQTLDLSNCKHLKKLPDSITSLKNLRYFNIRGCPLLDCMPSPFGILTNLRELPLYIVGEEAGTKIIELKGLNSLKGELFIKGLENVVDGEEAKEAGLKNKQLRGLRLSWEEETLDTSKDEVVIENLQPHINLEILNLNCYHGTYLPSWLSNLCSLRYLKLFQCLKLASLPEDLGKLEELHVYYCPNITSLPRCGLPKSLKTLKIVRSPLLKESCKRINGRDWIANMRV